jgi:hypothetical protein
VRVERTIHQRFARLDALAFLHVDVNAARSRIFLLGAVVGDHVDLRWPFQDLAELDRAVDFAIDDRFVRLLGLNNSTTRGRPPVMSLVLVVSRGIFAQHRPAIPVAIGPMRWARDGIR